MKAKNLKNQSSIFRFVKKDAQVEDRNVVRGGEQQAENQKRKINRQIDDMLKPDQRQIQNERLVPKPDPKLIKIQKLKKNQKVLKANQIEYDQPERNLNKHAMIRRQQQYNIDNCPQLTEDQFLAKIEEVKQEIANIESNNLDMRYKHDEKQRDIQIDKKTQKLESKKLGNQDDQMFRFQAFMKNLNDQNYKNLQTNELKKLNKELKDLWAVDENTRRTWVNAYREWISYGLPEHLLILFPKWFPYQHDEGMLKQPDEADLKLFYDQIHEKQATINKGRRLTINKKIKKRGNITPKPRKTKNVNRVLEEIILDDEKYEQIRHQGLYLSFLKRWLKNAPLTEKGDQDVNWGLPYSKIRTQIKYFNLLMSFGLPAVLIPKVLNFPIETKMIVE